MVQICTISQPSKYGASSPSQRGSVLPQGPAPFRPVLTNKIAEALVPRWVPRLHIKITENFQADLGERPHLNTDDLPVFDTSAAGVKSA